MEQVLNKKTGSYDVEFQSEKVEDIDFLPEDLQRAAKKSEEMSFQELYHYVQDVEAEGYDATSYRVDFHGKFALPVACLILCIIGTGITLRKNTNQGLSVTDHLWNRRGFSLLDKPEFLFVPGVWRSASAGHCGMDPPILFLHVLPVLAF